jgi:hypothetical protein
LKKEFAEILNEWQQQDIAEPAETAFRDLNWKPQRIKNPSSRPWAITSSRLHKLRVLPYIDMLILEEMNECQLAPSVKTAILFGCKADQYIEFGDSKPVKAGNLILSVESQCVGLLDKYDLSPLKLAARAKNELMKGYEMSKGNPEFVPSRALYFDLCDRLEHL